MAPPIILRRLVAASLISAALACFGAPHTSVMRQVMMGEWTADSGLEITTVSGDIALGRGARESLIRFTGVAVPDGATVSSAYLHLLSSEEHVGGSVYAARAVTNTAVLSSFWITDRSASTGSPVSLTTSSAAEDTMGDSTSFNVTSLVRAYLEQGAPAWQTGGAMVFGFLSVSRGLRLSVDVRIASLVVRYCSAMTPNSSTVRLASALGVLRTAAHVGQSNNTVTDQTFQTSWAWSNASTQSSVLELAYSPIPRNATITRAVISGRASGSALGTATHVVRTVVNGRTPSRSGSAIVAPALPADTVFSSASVVWSPGIWLVGSLYESPNLASIVQEFVSAATYAPGNNIVFRIDRVNVSAGNTRSFQIPHSLQLTVEYTVPRSGTQEFAMVLPSRLLRLEQQRGDGTGDCSDSPSPFPLFRRDNQFTGFQFSGVPFGPLEPVDARVLYTVDPRTAVPSPSEFPLKNYWRIEQSMASAELTSSNFCLEAGRSMYASVNLEDIPHPSAWPKTARSVSLAWMLKSGIPNYSTEPTTAFGFGRLLIRTALVNYTQKPSTPVVLWADQIALLLTFQVKQFSSPQFTCPSACHASAACVISQTHLNASCRCNAGWTGNGTVCQDINECLASSSCHASATCINTPGSFSCSCNSGWTSNGSQTTCSDMNECASPTTCGPNAICVNTPGSYSCTCNSGWTGSSSQNCRDINECSTPPIKCAANAACTNTPGSFFCACNSGWTGNGSQTCSDMNECASPTTCGPNAICTNTPGSFSCSCNSGWTGNGSQACSDIDECADGSAGCLDPSGCVNTPGSFRCERDESACAMATLRLTSPLQLARLPACGHALMGALELVGIAASGAAWQTALASLRTVERYVLLRDCVGFQWGAHTHVSLRVGLVAKQRLFRERFAVALINASGLTPGEAALMTGTQLVSGGDVLVEEACISGSSPAFWWADRQLVLNHSLAACSNACVMHRDGSRCVSQCANRTVCPAACPGQVLDSVEAIRAFPADCAHVTGSLHISDLMEPGAEVELRAALGNVQRIEGSLVITNNPSLIDLSFLATLRSVGSLLATYNSNLVTLYLPLLRCAASCVVASSHNLRLCSNSTSVLPADCATIDHVMRVTYSSLGPSTSVEQLKTDLLAELKLPANRDLVLETDNGLSADAVIGRLCANSSLCITRRSSNGTTTVLSFTVRIKVASNESFVLSALAGQTRFSMPGGRTIESIQRAILSSRVDTRLVLTPVFLGRIVQLRVSVGSGRQTVAEVFGSNTQLYYQLEPVLTATRLAEVLRKNAGLLKKATSFTASAKAVQFVRAAHNRGGGALDLAICGLAVASKECLRQDWTYRVSVTAVNRQQTATAVLPEFSPASSEARFNMSANFAAAAEQLRVSWQLSGTNATVLYARLEVAVVDGVGQGPRHAFGCSTSALTTVRLNISREQQHNPPPVLRVGACHNDSQAGGVRHCWQPWTSYLVSLRPTSSLFAVQLQPASVVAVTPEAAPESGVIGLTQVARSASSVTLAFAPPARRNGVIVGVTVRLVPLHHDNFSVDASAPVIADRYVALTDVLRRDQVCRPLVASLQVTVAGLESFRRYELTLTPHTSAGRGAVSSNALVITSEPFPVQPTGIKAVAEGPGMIRLTWLPMRGTNVRYRVESVDGNVSALLAEVREPTVLVAVGLQVQIICVSALGSSAPSPVFEASKAESSSSHSTGSVPTIVGVVLGLGVVVLAALIAAVRRRNGQPLSVSDLVNEECSEKVNLLDRYGIQLVRPLGRGRMGQVFLGSVVRPTGFLVPGDHVAVKSLTDRYGHVTSDRIQGFLKEIARATELAAAEHPNIIATFGCCIEPGLPVMLVQEFAELGSLLEVLRTHRGSTVLNDQDKIMAARDVISALAFMHARGYVHRDVSARNCLVTEGYVVKVGDFGSVIRKDGPSSREGGGKLRKNSVAPAMDLPIRWMPPEALIAMTTDTFTSQHEKVRTVDRIIGSLKPRRTSFTNLQAQDVWSFGVLLWELMTDGEVPYGDVDEATALMWISGGQTLPQPTGCPDLIFQLMQRCWALDSFDRPSMDDLTVQLHEVFFQLDQQATDALQGYNYAADSEVDDDACHEAAVTASGAGGGSGGKRSFASSSGSILDTVSPKSRRLTLGQPLGSGARRGTEDSAFDAASPTSPRTRRGTEDSMLGNKKSRRETFGRLVDATNNLLRETLCRTFDVTSAKARRETLGILGDLISSGSSSSQAETSSPARRRGTVDFMLEPPVSSRICRETGDRYVDLTPSSPGRRATQESPLASQKPRRETVVKFDESSSSSSASRPRLPSAGLDIEAGRHQPPRRATASQPLRRNLRTNDKIAQQAVGLPHTVV